MFERSAIKRTGQWWKALTAFWGTVIAGGTMFFGVHWMTRQREAALGLTLGALAAALLSAAFGIAAIRCPRCGMRWVWAAMRRAAHDQWLASLLVSVDCPRCGHPGAAPPAADASGA